MPSLRVPETARKRRRRNRSRIRLSWAGVRRVVFTSRWISLFLLVATVGTLAALGMYEEYYVTLIPVDGVSVVAPEEVANASGLAGTHAFAVDPDEAAERIQALPGIISATVTLNWPNEAQISVREELPVAVWVQDGEQYWVSDLGTLLPARLATDGLLRIQADSASASPDLAAQTGRSKLEPEGDGLVANDGKPFVSPDVVAGALQLHELRPGLDTLYYEPAGGLSFVDGSGWRVYFGSGEDMPRKLAVYEAIVTYLREEGLTPIYISVSNQEKPFYLVQEQDREEEQAEG